MANFGYGATCAKALDRFRVEAEFLKNLLVVLADLRGSPCSYFAHAMHLNRAANRRSHLPTGAFKRNDDVIRSQLGIVDHFLWVSHCAERDGEVSEDLI